MKRTLLLLSILIFGFTAIAGNNSYELRSNHSFSSTILGFEYSYEGRIADRWTLIGRAGFVPTSFYIKSTQINTTFSGNMAPGLSFEARWYSNIAKRAEQGKSTYNNSSDFISMRLRANTADGFDISFTPAYGIRRSFRKLWFHEFTIGPKFGLASDNYFIGVHVQYRIGITF